MTKPTAPQAKSKSRLPQTETPAAAQAFADYVTMGSGRTLEALAEAYRNSTEPVPSKQLSRLKIWSTAFHWQDRIKTARNEATERKLAEAAELDADTFLQSSQKLNATIRNEEETEAVIKIRESVRKPMPKGGASVNVSVSVEVRHLAEQLANELGMSAEDLIADATKIAEEAWKKAGKA